MEQTVKIVGIGPGNAEYLTPVSRKAIDQAQVLAGGVRLVHHYARPDQEIIIIDHDLNKAVDDIKARAREKTVAVLTSGDPGLFSIANYLISEMGPNRVELLPGISSLQLMFARLKMPWQDAKFISVHGRSLQNLEALFPLQGNSAVLTGGKQTPQAVALYLTQKGIGDKKVALGKDLSYPEEKIVFATLRQLADDTKDYMNSVMVIFDE